MAEDWLKHAPPPLRHIHQTIDELLIVIGMAERHAKHSKIAEFVKCVLFVHSHWEDLDPDLEKIKHCFLAVTDGLQRASGRPADCLHQRAANIINRWHCQLIETAARAKHQDYGGLRPDEQEDLDSRIVQTDLEAHFPAIAGSMPPFLSAHETRELMEALDRELCRAMNTPAAQRLEADAGSETATGGKGESEEPKVYLTSWREILVALRLTNNTEDREKVRNLNDTRNGPILFPGQGAQPKVEKTKLIEWWNSLEAQWEVGYQRGRDAGPTAKAQHPYGKTGTVTPDIGGSVKHRRKDRKG